MNSFEYLIAIIAIILGLGITHLLAGLGKTIYRLTGHGSPLKLSWVHFLWVLNIFFWMVAYWWYTFGHAEAVEWTFGPYLLLLPFPVLVYLQCVILYPHKLDDVSDLGTYFMQARRWFFSLMLAASGADWILALIDPQATAAYVEKLGLSVVVVVVYTAIVAIVGMIVKDVRVHIALALSSLLLGMWQIFDDHPTLGAVPF